MYICISIGDIGCRSSNGDHISAKRAKDALQLGRAAIGEDSGNLLVLKGAEQEGVMSI